jgi:hypothetical protein
MHLHSISFCEDRAGVKAAGVPLGMIRNFLKGQEPLFHAMAGANARGLLKTPRALTASEGIARGLVQNIEAGGTFGRHPVQEVLKDVFKPILGKDRAVIKIRDLITKGKSPFGPEAPKSLIAAGPARNMTAMRYGGDVADYAESSLTHWLGQFAGAGKNWADISLSRGNPFRSYGEFGIMTTPGRVAGKLQANRPTDKAIYASPTWVTNRGTPVGLRLPSASGKIFYHPSLENADLARQLQLLYGKHNVIPWSSRLQRKLKKLQLNRTDLPNSGEAGNLGYVKMKEKFPSYDADYEATKNKVTSWLGAD